MHLLLKLSILVVAASTASITPKAASTTTDTSKLKLESFEFLGCSGDWKEQSPKPDVWRLTTLNQVNYLVRHPGTCGLEARKPTSSFANGKLDMAYELYSPDGTAVMCECEYWARFTFGESAMLLRDVTFNGESVEKRGEWPIGP